MTKISAKEAIKKHQEYIDFEKLLDPYREGGTKESPVRRTYGTIVDYFLNKKKYPVDVVGAALLTTLVEMNGGRVFDGKKTDNGEIVYGSMGTQLVSYMRELCDRYNQAKLADAVMRQIAEARVKEMQEFINTEIENRLRFGLPWFVRVWTPSRWVWLEKKRQEKALTNESS